MERQRGAARRNDTTARRRPLQAALCRGRRCCAASTAVGRGVGARSARAGARGCVQRQCGRRGGSSGARESGVPGACTRTGGGVRGEQRAAGARIGVRRAAVGRAHAGRRTGRAGRAARPERGVPRWRARPGGAGGAGGEGAGQARAAEKKGRRERRGKERKKRKRKWEKEKKKKKEKEGREIKREREGEGRARRR